MKTSQKQFVQEFYEGFHLNYQTCILAAENSKYKKTKNKTQLVLKSEIIKYCQIYFYFLLFTQIKKNE